jgi:hypothetical protein
MSLTWSLKNRSIEPNHVTFIYESATPHLRLTWEWAARAKFGPIEHTTRIENLSGGDILIPIQPSLSAHFGIAASERLMQMSVEKGADTPSASGTHYAELPPDEHWGGFSSTYAHPHENEPREIIPWTLLERPDHTGLYVGIEFSGRTHIALSRDQHSISIEAGLNPQPGRARIRLAAGETLSLPTIFLGAFTGGPEAAGNDLRRWVRAVLGNPETWKNPHYPLLVSNSWGAGLAVDEPLALRMIGNAADLGLEMFHLDAGWFRAVGDWHPDPKKFPHGLVPIAEAVHRRGMKFGLWLDWAQAGISTEPGALNVRDPKVKDWLVTDLPPEWHPEEFKGETIDIGVPAAEEWVKNETARVMRDYGIDMLEHDGYVVAQGCVRGDHPHAAPDHVEIQSDSGFRFVYSSNSTDVSQRATRAYYAIQQHLRETKPGILLEACNDGGRMVDFGSAAHADYFSITDTYDPLSNRRALYDTSHVLPPAMLESYVEKWNTPKIENFLYMLRSGMMGWFTLMQDPATWTAEQKQAAKKEFEFYKSDLRPLVRDADLYHVSERPDGVHWDGLEYFDAQKSRGALYAFRGSGAEATHVFVLQGLSPEARYLTHFRDASSADAELSGGVLMTQGLRVNLPVANSSEIVTIREVSR